MRFGPKWPQKRLLELAANSNQRLTGAALYALLDQGTKVRNLIPFLHERSDNVYDAYDLVLNRIPRECDADDLAPLLNHIANWHGLSAHTGSGGRFAEGLITKSVASLHRADIRDALTKFLLVRFERDHSLFFGNDLRTLSKSGLENPEQRRQLVLALTKAWSQRPTRKILELDLPILREDIPWLFNQVADAKGSVADLLATAASTFAWQIDIEHKESLERAYAASAELRALLPPAEGTGDFRCTASAPSGGARKATKANGGVRNEART